MKDRQMKRRKGLPVPRSLAGSTAKALGTRVAAVEGDAPCPRCGTEGIVDFFDLIRGRAELHCPSCPTGWALETEASMAHLAD